MAELNERQEMFCREFVRQGVGTWAVIDAGYAHKGAAAQASRLLDRPEIQARIAERRAQVARQHARDTDALLARLDAICEMAIRDHHYHAAVRVVTLQAQLAGLLPARGAARAAAAEPGDAAGAVTADHGAAAAPADETRADDPNDDTADDTGDDSGNAPGSDAGRDDPGDKPGGNFGDDMAAKIRAEAARALPPPGAGTPAAEAAGAAGAAAAAEPRAAVAAADTAAAATDDAPATADGAAGQAPFPPVAPAPACGSCPDGAGRIPGAPARSRHSATGRAVPASGGAPRSAPAAQESLALAARMLSDVKRCKASADRLAAMAAPAQRSWLRAGGARGPGSPG